jgi:hypothetical protein
VLAGLCRYTPLALRLSATLLYYDLSLDVESYIQVLSEQVKQTATYKNRPEALFKVFIRQIYERLDPFSQQILSQLSIFSDGFVQTAATALADTDGSGHTDIYNHLDALAQLNLLAFDEATEFYRMHPSVRDFASEHLVDSSETRLRRYNTMQTLRKIAWLLPIVAQMVYFLVYWFLMTIRFTSNKPGFGYNNKSKNHPSSMSSS